MIARCPPIPEVARSPLDKRSVWCRISRLCDTPRLGVDPRICSPSDEGAKEGELSRTARLRGWNTGEVSQHPSCISSFVDVVSNVARLFVQVRGDHGSKQIVLGAEFSIPLGRAVKVGNHVKDGVDS